MKETSLAKLEEAGRKKAARDIEEDSETGSDQNS